MWKIIAFLRNLRKLFAYDTTRDAKEIKYSFYKEIYIELI